MTFESSVNPEGIQTSQVKIFEICQFESSVNPEGIQTADGKFWNKPCLRVV